MGMLNSSSSQEALWGIDTSHCGRSVIWLEVYLLDVELSSDKGKKKNDNVGGTQKKIPHCIPRGLRYGIW